MTAVRGLHHVSAIAGDAQRNLGFYARILGLRLVKRTVNYDDPTGYHLYYGDESGTPGSLLTFFPMPAARHGRAGVGQVAITALSILPASIAFWIERLIRHGIVYQGPTKREGGETVLAFKDHDGLMLELVGHPAAGDHPGWAGVSAIPAEHAIRGIHGVTLWVENAAPTERMLVDTLGFRAVHEVDNTRRYAVQGGGPRHLIDVRAIGGFMNALGGVGTVHHVAWDVGDDDTERVLRQEIIDAGLQPTPEIDRNYFRSVYFREPGQVLFELATDHPGFTLDESLDQLGTHLALPPRLEDRRVELEGLLPALDP